MGCTPIAAAMAPPPAVSVNNTVIARDAIAREVQNHPADKPILSWHSAARALVVRELLIQEARRRGIPAAPLSDDRGRRETEEEALIRALIAQAVVTPQPDIDACKRYYAQNRRRFRSSPIFEASHILFAARQDDPAAFAGARADAATALAMLKHEPDRFDDVARQYSTCPSAAHGGNLGQLTLGQTTAEFEAALLSLAPGEMSQEPIATRYGFHIVRLDRRIDGREQPFDLVAQRIADYLRDCVNRRAIAQFIARLVSSANISGISIAGAREHRVS